METLSSSAWITRLPRAGWVSMLRLEWLTEHSAATRPGGDSPDIPEYLALLLLLLGEEEDVGHKDEEPRLLPRVAWPKRSTNTDAQADTCVKQ